MMNPIIPICSMLFALFLLTCCGQEDFTCKRQSGVSSVLTDSINNATKRGLPGRKGPKGDKGFEGEKGERGLPGVPDHSEVTQFRDELSVLRRQLQTLVADEVSSLRQQLNTQVSNFKAGFQRLSDGWIGLYNGYQYKLDTSPKSHSSGERLCRRLRAELAVYGVQDMGNRRILDRALGLRSRGRTGVWIGLDDIRKEGSFHWTNGEKMRSGATALWSTGEPNDAGGREDCVVIDYLLLCNDVPCSHAKYTFCEKRWV